MPLRTMQVCEKQTQEQKTQEKNQEIAKQKKKNIFWSRSYFLLGIKTH